MQHATPNSFTKSLEGFNLTLSLNEGEITIESESQTDFTVYSSKLSDDSLPESAKFLFDDVRDLYEGFMSTLQGHSSTNSLSVDKDGVLTFCHQATISSKTKVIKIIIQLERKSVEEEFQLRKNLARANKRIEELERKVKDMSTSKAEIESDYREIHPEFDLECKNKVHLAFPSPNTVVSTEQTGHWYAVPAKEPLPHQGKTRFSVRINRIGGRRFMIGLMHESQKNSQSCYAAKENYFLYLQNNHVYRSTLNSPGSLVLVAEEGNTISVLVDMDQEVISFYIEGELIYRVKPSFKTAEKRSFYPCVEMYETNQSVSFI